MSSEQWAVYSLILALPLDIFNFNLISIIFLDLKKQSASNQSLYDIYLYAKEND